MYKLRIRVFLAIIVLVLMGLAVRLAHLQVVQGRQNRDRYERSMRVVQSLVPSRGQIMDRSGLILAVDKPCKDLCFEYGLLVMDSQWAAAQQRQIAHQCGVTFAEAEPLFQDRCRRTWELASRLAAGQNVDLGETVRTIVAHVRHLHERAGRRVKEEDSSHPIVPGLDDEAAAEAESSVRGGQTVGAEIWPSHARTYPYGQLACHVIGVTGAGTNPDQKVGVSGVEKMCEETLHGQWGTRVIDRGESDVDVEYQPAQTGQDVHLTLDMRLQQALAEEMGRTGHNGAAVVLSVARGEVLALVSVPGYDLNKYRSDYKELAANEMDLPLRNRAICERYPPGSTVKAAVALAALAAGKITPQTVFHCQGMLFANDPLRWRCDGVHGDVDLNRALMKSCNVYFYELGQHLGPELLCQWLETFGFNSPTGVGLPEERGGFVPDANWMLRNYRRNFSPGDARQMAIGQGPLLVTPMEVANYMATVARDGKVLAPTVTLEMDANRRVHDLGFAPGHLQAVREGLRNVICDSEGTGYKVFHEPGAVPLGVEVAGKTGTADAHDQMLDVNEDGRKESVRHGNMAWFVGYAPAGRPTIAFAIVVEYVAGHGATEAGPVAREMIRVCKELQFVE